VTVEAIHEAVKTASRNHMKDILQFTDTPLVSTDIIGNPHSSIYDATFTEVIGGRYIKTLNWYDNEWGYSSRVCNLLERLATF